MKKAKTPMSVVEAGHKGWKARKKKLGPERIREIAKTASDAAAVKRLLAKQAREAQLTGELSFAAARRKESRAAVKEADAALGVIG